MRHGVGRHLHERAWRTRALIVVMAAAVAGATTLSIGWVRADGSDGAHAAVPAPPAAGLVRPAASFQVLAARLRAPAADAASALAAASAPLPPTEVAAAPLAVTGDRPAAPHETAIVPPPVGGFQLDAPGVVAASAGRGDGGGGGPAPDPSPLPPTRYPDATPSGGTWALLVGIDDYPGVKYDLRSAVNDVQDVDEALRRSGVTADRRMLLRDGQATAGVIRAGLDWVTAHAGPDATIVVFFAGHVQKLAPGTEALVGADGDVVQDVEVAQLLDRSPATRSWIAIAACYAGGFDELVRPGRILTAAASSSSLAYESSTFGRSYLVEYMVRRAMLGARIGTVEAAFARAAEELRRDHPDRVPLQFDRVEGDLVLRQPPPAPDTAPGTADPSPPPPQQPPQQPPAQEPPPSGDGCSNLTLGVVRCEDEDA